MSLTFSFSFVNTPSFYSGLSTSSLVPDIFPVGINGRPYMVDMRSGRFQRGFEPRVRDSVDQSTAPGEAAINPGGLWRRGEVSWHLGAGQRYADTAEAEDYRFFRSNGVNPWTRGQLTLLNATALNTGAGAPTSSVGKLLVVGSKIFVIDGTSVKYATSLSGNWTTITSPAGTSALKDLASDGTTLFACFTATSSGVYSTPVASPGTWTRMVHEDLDRIGYVNGRLMGSDGHIIYDASVRAYSSGSIAAGDTLLTHRNTAFTCVGFAGSNTHVYAAGFAGDVSLIYKTTIKADGSSMDAMSVALQLPRGEIVSSVAGYLGNIFIGSNKGVRYATVDASGNLTAGALIPTSGDVNGFTFDERFAWFGWSNYDSGSGLGRLDLSSFVAANTPAHATDLMYGSSTAVVLSVASFDTSRLFSITGVGVVYENTASKVASGEIESGVYRWGIPDRKFIARVDTRSLPLDGSVESYMKLDGGDYALLGTWDSDDDTENSFGGSDDHAIEAQFKFALNRASTVTLGPTLTRWNARAYAAPFRSEVFIVPVLVHGVLNVKGKDYYFDVDDELEYLRGLIQAPQIVLLQIRDETVSVIVEDLEWSPVDGRDREWLWEGTATVTMRSVQE